MGDRWGSDQLPTVEGFGRHGDDDTWLGQQFGQHITSVGPHLPAQGDTLGLDNPEAAR